MFTELVKTESDYDNLSNTIFINRFVHFYIHLQDTGGQFHAKNINLRIFTTK